MNVEGTPDISKLVEFVRWGGIVMTIPLIAVVVVLLRVVEGLTHRLSTRFSSRRPMLLMVQSVVRFVVYVVALAIGIGLSFRLDSTALTVFGGALALAVGFAMRDLVAAFIAGVTIMFDRPFHVGDRVSFAGQYGDIVKIGLRSVRMITLENNVITIPNNKVLTDVTVSGTYGSLEMQVAMDFYVGIDQDLARAIAILREACLTSPYVFLTNPVQIEARQVIVANIMMVRLKARPWVYDCKYERAFETDVYLRVLEAFKASEIAPPAVLYSALGATPAAAAG